MQSHIYLLRLLQTSTHRGRMHMQMVCNLCEPIPIGPVRHMDEPRRRLFPLKQHAQCGPLRLRLSPRNVPDHPIGLVLGHKLLGAQIDLPDQCLPRARSPPAPRLRRSDSVPELLPLAPQTARESSQSSTNLKPSCPPPSSDSCSRPIAGAVRPYWLAPDSAPHTDRVRVNAPPSPPESP